MEIDLFGGGPVPATPRRGRIVQHLPPETPLVLFETIGHHEDEKRAPAPLRGAQEHPGDAPSRPAPHVRHSATSRAAAQAVTPLLKGKRLEVLREVCRSSVLRDGFTDNELIRHMVDHLGWNANTPRARRIELVVGGWLVDSGSTRSNTRLKSTVWMPSEAAMNWYREQQK